MSETTTPMMVRAKKTNGHKWVYGYYAPIWASYSTDVRHGIVENNTTYEIDFETMGRYLDKDDLDHDIYQGDVLVAENAESDTLTLICRFGTLHMQLFSCPLEFVGFYYERTDNHQTCLLACDTKTDKLVMSRRVIGNIYDNPELANMSNRGGIVQ